MISSTILLLEQTTVKMALKFQITILKFQTISKLQIQMTKTFLPNFEDPAFIALF